MQQIIKIQNRRNFTTIYNSYKSMYKLFTSDLIQAYKAINGQSSIGKLFKVSKSGLNT